MSFYLKKKFQLSLVNIFELSKHVYLSKKIICISNIPNSLFIKDILYQKKFLGQYGRIKQMILNINNKNENNVIVQFDTINQAALSVLSLHNFKIEKKKLQVNYFMIKYCHNFLNNKQCKDNNCLYLHELKINDYSYLKLKNKKLIDNYKLALEILHIEKNIFEIIYNKLVGDDYYNKHMKFPKVSMKKLKNEEFVNSIKNYYSYNLSHSKDNNSINESKNMSNIPKQTFDNSFNENNYIFKNKQSSRFNFVNKINKFNLSVIIPESILDIIDKVITLYVFEKKNINNLFNKNVHIDDYNCKWNELIKNIKL